MKKKVVLIHPPTRYLVIPKWIIPLTLLCLRSYLISKGFDAVICDLADAKNDYLSKIPLGADVYGVTVYTPQDQLAKEISIYLKNNTDAIVVAGGHHATFMDVSFMKESRYDAVIRGEGEIPFEEVLRGKDFSEIQSLTYRKGSKIIRNDMRPLERDIDIYPFPRLDGVNIEEYPGTYVKRSQSDYRVGVIFSRGCVGKCAFCTSVNFWQRKVRFHSFSWIKENIDYLVNYGVRDLEIYDDNFIIHKSFEKVCHLFKQYGMQYSCMGISRFITEEKSRILKETGCTYVALGIETGSDRLLRIMSKPSTLEDHKKAVHILKRAGLTVKGLFMIGLPQTTQEDIEQTVKFIKENQMDSYALATFVPFPGTPIWNFPDNYACEIDRSIPFSDYLILSKSLDTKLVLKNSQDVKWHREQILAAMGEKCTLFNTLKWERSRFLEAKG